MSADLAAGLAAELLAAAGALELGLVLSLVAGRDTIDPPDRPRYVLQLVPVAGVQQLPTAGHAPLYAGRPALMGQRP